MYLHSNRAVIMIEAHLLFFAEQGLEIPYVEVCMAYISIQVSSKLTNSSTAVYFVALARSWYTRRTKSVNLSGSILETLNSTRCV